MSMSDSTYGMGGLVISHHQQQRIDHDLEAFKQSLRHKRKKRRINTKIITNNQLSKPMRNRRVYQTQNISYTDLLNRVYSRLHPNQSLEDGPKQKHSVPAPIVEFLPRKTIWTNFQQICNALRRSPNHLKKFFENELVTFCNFDAARHLVLRGNWPNSHIRFTLKRYIIQFVQCEDCSSLHTRISRNNKQRLYELTCNECTAHRNCQKIEKAFKTIANRRQRIQQRQANMR